ncbi:toll-like receptor 4, partial [Stylophora pistillata]|uniref:toll-like receptor 4 n=1 Tax=Stylophora pistillata TaxID=50429 RepID=UPI000C053308
ASGGEGNRTSVAVQINNTYNREKNQTSLDTTAVPNTELIKPTWAGGYEYPDWFLRCLMNKSRVEKSFTPTIDEIKMAFEELNNTGKFIATLSWTPFDIQLTNWTGYAIIYRFVESGSQSEGMCQEFDKNATNFTITNSSYGLTTGSPVALYITSLPYPVDIPIFFSFNELTYSTVQTTQSKAGGDKKLRAIIAAILSSTCAVVIIGLIIFRYRCRSLPLPSDLEFEYDAFIIFSSEDSQWVVNTLIPTLEENHGIRCCVHYRDFIPGVTFRKNMVDSVYKCKKTIAVVSTHFFNSKYCGSELDYALHRLMERRDDSLVVIKLDDVEKGKLPKELQKRSYIDYAKSVEKESWEKKLVSCLNSKTRDRYN